MQMVAHVKDFLSVGGHEIDYANSHRIGASQFRSALTSQRMKNHLTPDELAGVEKITNASKVTAEASPGAAAGGRTNTGSQPPRNPVGGQKGFRSKEELDAATGLVMLSKSGTSSSTNNRPADGGVPGGPWTSPSKTGPAPSRK
ncbi:hypothetical protein RJT17_36000 [Streptomyces sp. P5-A9]|uniref:hypothetical protein n=1 Tax=Streptomyces sp. P5-A9 TaxID=3071730 RepID=UPI002FCBC7E0